jgi:hypothetical protein
MISRNDITLEKDSDVSLNDNVSRELALFYPTESLHDQVAGQISLYQCTAMVTVSSVQGRAIRKAATSAVLSIIDVTEQVSQAMSALDELAGILDPGQLAVYTERMHEGLERFVRVRGILLLLGPVEAAQWQALFRQAGFELQEQESRPALGPAGTLD